MAPPELTNAWLAEHVLGWIPVSGYDAVAERIIANYGGQGVPEPDYIHTTCVWYTPEGAQVACEECGDLPDFLHNPADALRFVDYFIEQHQVEIYLSMTQTWVQCVIRYSWCCGEASTLALAICRAAQAWVLRQEAPHGPR